MTSPSTRRLLKESTDLYKNPSPYFTAGPVDESNLHDWHFTLAGPPTPSPYAGGFYHGRITFPPTYPLRPPSFRFLTPSARFEVNREICLSISGHHEETWQPAWGVRTALLAIRSEIFGSESKGQVGGNGGGETLRKEYARLSRSWKCRECGVENEGAMRELWERCKEKGVEVDVEGSDDGKDLQTAEGNEKQNEGIQTSVASQSAELASAPVSVPAPAPASASASASVQAPQLQSQPLTSTPALAPAPAASRPQPTPTIPAPITEPANTPWLDRAIIGVVVALILLVLRRVTDADEL
ncbi:Ubiquitin-conjugating enzyme E2 [Penicillium atrosanguineum]|uniref:Ubiquitin-conjugating enzyme E2 n=1 Tax=Penicillium atrosanguineum TaxID=1132637 RepID=A0A9W9U5Z3_9EURO|nr:Ubiquitin-conjugating enzyme E2 [Penicillium atrosanguineum]